MTRGPATELRFDPGGNHFILKRQQKAIWNYRVAMPKTKPAPFCLIELHGSSKQPVANPEFRRDRVFG
jgi:hypothetical protein